MKHKLKIALPSKGSLGKATIDFLFECGIPVERKNDRQYTGTIKGYDIDVLFQRAEDIIQKVREGTTHLGLTGRDLVEEFSISNDSVQVLIPRLDYGKAKLVVGVPESWIHISSIYDLADLAAKWRLGSTLRNIKIATKFKKLTEKFLHENNIYNYTLVDVSGVIEVAPKLKIADIIVDLTSSGITLRENHLKTIEGGTILKSEACFIGNSCIFSEKGKAYQPVVEELIDKIESHLRARDYVRVLANIVCDDPKKVDQDIQSYLKEKSIETQTYTISRSASHFRHNASYVNINLVVKSEDLYEIVRCLRKHKPLEIASSKVDYLFLDKSDYFQKALDANVIKS